MKDAQLQHPEAQVHGVVPEDNNVAGKTTTADEAITAHKATVAENVAAAEKPTAAEKSAAADGANGGAAGGADSAAADARAAPVNKETDDGDDHPQPVAGKPLPEYFYVNDKESEVVEFEAPRVKGEEYKADFLYRPNPHEIRIVEFYAQ